MILEEAKHNFAALKVAPPVQQAALQNLKWWLEDEQFADYLPQIESMITKNRWDFLLDSFYQVLPFGTGGRRGPVGIGPNRFNPWTLGASAQGHAEYLKRRFPGQPLTVVVAHDVRQFLDLNELYDQETPSPCLGLSSRDFAEIAAGVYAANGVKAVMLPPASTTFISTPELSFAIRKLEASAGLNISASHNPPDDNGGKFYNETGGQEIPPQDQEMAELVDQVKKIDHIEYTVARNQGLIVDYDPELHNDFIALNLGTSLSRQREAVIAFSPLHGTGEATVAELLSRAGFTVHKEPDQSVPDGSFKAVPFRAPNPEVPQSMGRVIQHAQKVDADLAIVCDPDADRLGVAVKDRAGAFQFLNGNQLAVLVAEYRLLKRAGSIIVKTEVTTRQVDLLAKHYSAQVVGDLLVGFKYIGEVLRRLEVEGHYNEAHGGLKDFCAGVEESHGILVTGELRDKDAAGGALALAEYASELKAEGKTLLDALASTWERDGRVHNEMVSCIMRGAAGKGRIEQIQASLRQDPPKVIGGRKVLGMHDRQDESGPFGPIKSATDSASRDMLVFELENDVRVILRPSGTESKTKIYAEVVGAAGDQGLPAATRQLALDFLALVLKRVDINLPAWALKISDLVPIELKQEFESRFLPGLRKRLASGEEVREWIDEALKPYGKDPRELVAEALLAWGELGESDAGAVLAAFELNP